jgi:uncharacterized integral membrane protein
MMMMMIIIIITILIIGSVTPRGMALLRSFFHSPLILACYLHILF